MIRHHNRRHRRSIYKLLYVGQVLVQVMPHIWPAYEDGPRFSLSNAIAAAYASGKVARAGRIAERAKKFDNT